MSRQIRRVIAGMALTPESVNNPVEDLVSWLSNLETKVDSFVDPSNVLIYEQPLDIDTFVGAPVYFNKTTGTYSRARVSTRIEGSYVVADDSCYVLGIVQHKTSPTSGHICLNGVCEIDFGENISNQDAYFDYTTLGLRYLSAIASGRVQEKAPAVAIPVAFVLNTNGVGKAKIYVNICLDKIMGGHYHHRLILKAVPAGDWDGTTFTNPDTTIEGWLPVSSFDSSLQIPTGALYGYNLNVSTVKEHFPVILPEQFKISWTQYTNNTGSDPFIAELEDQTYLVNQDGIWWLDTRRPPWYFDVWEQGDCSNHDCSTKEWYFRTHMIAYYTSINYNTDMAVVMSLTPEPTSGLEVTNIRTGEPAIRGDLLIDLALQNKILSERWSNNQSIALKHIGTGRANERFEADPESAAEQEQRNAFFFGPVVESVTLDSVFTQAQSTNNVTAFNPATGTYLPSGHIKLSLSDAWSNLPLPVQSIHLDQMRDAFLGGMVALAFAPNQRSGFSGQIYLPRFPYPEASIRIRVSMVAGAAGQITNAMFTGRHIVIPPAACNTEILPLPMTIPSLCDPQSSDKELAFNFDLTVPQAQMYFTICSEPITVSTNSMLWFSLHREAGGFNGPLSIIRLEAYLDPML